MLNPSCFANYDGKCLALKPNVACCDGCLFYRPKAQAEAESDRAWDIIAAKTRGHQQYIAGKYYQGKMPWKEAGRHDR